jgi:hypothetical protein
MKMNSQMASRWGQIAASVDHAGLAGALRNLAESPLVDIAGAVVLQDQIGSGLSCPDPDDLTGFEALVNKIHISDFLDEKCREEDALVQGAGLAQALIARLGRLGLPFRIILSNDPHSGEVTLRFFVRREGQEWSSDDPEEYALEEVVFWDL